MSENPLVFKNQNTMQVKLILEKNYCCCEHSHSPAQSGMSSLALFVG